MALRASDLIRAAAPGVGCSMLMAGVVMALGQMLPPLPAPVRLGILVPAGGLAFLAALLVCARGTLSELIALVVRRAPPDASAG